MERRGTDLRLFDIIESIEIVRAETKGLTLEEFEANRRSRLLVERGIEIISEASRHLPQELKDRHTDVAWRNVAGIGNVIRHDYERVAPDVLWSIIHDHLPSMERVCRTELTREQTQAQGPTRDRDR